jgi:hypothetical protein
VIAMAENGQKKFNFDKFLSRTLEIAVWPNASTVPQCHYLDNPIKRK